MRKSKYLGFTSGDWFCTHLGISRVQPVYTNKRDEFGRRIKSKNRHQTYYYIFERLTSDGKAMKMVRLSAQQMSDVYRNKITVEEIANKKKNKQSQEFVSKVSYSFCD